MNDDDERIHLLQVPQNAIQIQGLSTFFVIVCILDVFGVFPIIALPKAILDCGGYGILVIVLVCSVQLYTASLLGKCWIIAEEVFPTIRKKSRYPYAALAEVTFGRQLASFVTFLLDLTIFGGSIPNLIVASQNLQLVGQRINADKFDISYCYWIIIIGIILCPILWLGSPKDMKCICSVSVIIITTVFILTCGCLLSSSTQNVATNAQVQFPWEAVLQAYGIIAFQFDIHPTILTIQVDMKDKTKLPKALIGGFLASLFMFGVTTLIAFLKYGTSLQPSVLETLPTSIPLHFAAVLVAIQLCLTSAISNSALFQQMEDCMRISKDFNPKRCILRTSLTVLSIVIAESVPRFDLVMSLIGGTLTGPLVFILPPILYMRMLSLQRIYEETLAMESFTNIVLPKEEHSKDVSKYMSQRFRDDFRPSISFAQRYQESNFRKYGEWFVCWLIIIWSGVMTVSTTYLNVNSAIFSYSNVSKPCIYNVTLALIYL